MKVRLGAFAHLEGDAVEVGEEVYDRPARIVYVGKFDSMDGEVKVTEPDILRLVQNTRSKLEFSRQSDPLGGGIPLYKDCPPIQVDHTTSGWDTVGRVIDVWLGEFEGKAAAFAMCRFLGKENCDRARDGRWTTLSVGADFDAGVLSELTVTPFPAAQHASLLSKGDPMNPKERCRKHLMEHHKLSAEESDKKLSEMDDEAVSKMAAEADEHEKKMAADKKADEDKLAAEEEEKKKLAAAEKEKADKEEGEKKAQLSAAKASVIQLSKGFRKTAGDVHLAARRETIVKRLSSVRSRNLMTPAEAKKINIDDLLKRTDEAVTAFFEGFETREPVLPIGTVGSAKAEPVAKLSKTVQERTRLSQRLSNMPFTAKNVAKRLGFEPGKEQPAEKEENLSHEAPQQDTEHLEKHFSAVCKMMDEGKREDALKALRAYMSSTSPAAAPEEMAGEMHPDHEKRMSALAENVKGLQNQFEDLVRLVSPVLGIEASELN